MSAIAEHQIAACRYSRAPAPGRDRRHGLTWPATPTRIRSVRWSARSRPDRRPHRRPAAAIRPLSARAPARARRCCHRLARAGRACSALRRDEDPRRHPRRGPRLLARFHREARLAAGFCTRTWSRSRLWGEGERPYLVMAHLPRGASSRIGGIWRSARGLAASRLARRAHRSARRISTSRGSSTGTSSRGTC